MHTFTVHLFLTCIIRKYFGELEPGKNNKNSNQSQSNITGFLCRTDGKSTKNTEGKE
jgi:hypothetical protein